MKLSHLRVLNYRALKDVSIPLSPFVCITGENNAGKSSVLQTLSLFLSGTSLKSTDYFDPDKPISIEVRLSDVTDADLGLLAEEHRDRIADLLKNGSLTLVRQYGTDRKGQLGFFGTAPVDARFLDENVDRLLKGKRGKDLREALEGAFPELQSSIPSITSQESARQRIKELADALPDSAKETRFLPLPTGLDKSIVPMLPERIYIPAVKDLADDTKTAESSSFGKILAIVTKAVEPYLLEERDLFEKLSRKLTRTVGAAGEIEDHRVDVLRQIERAIEGYVRESFSNVKLEIEIPPPDLKTLLSTARILADDGVKGTLELKGYPLHGPRLAGAS